MDEQMDAWEWNGMEFQSGKKHKNNKKYTTVSVGDSVLYSAIKQSYKTFSGEQLPHDKHFSRVIYSLKYNIMWSIVK